MSEVPQKTLGNGDQSVIKLADFIDYGLYLLNRRQADKPFDENNHLVEEVAASKLFRLLHKLSDSIMCALQKKKGVNLPNFDIRSGIDSNGMHGKGIAFDVKSTAPSVDLEADEEVSVSTKDTNKYMPKLYICKAIERLEHYIPEQKRRLTSGKLSNGKDGYSSSVSAHELNKWRVKRLDNKSEDLLRDFGSFINRLDDRELISLGRHESAKNTEDSIRYLLNKWKKNIGNTLKSLEELQKKNNWPSEDLIEQFRRLYYCSEEMVFKSVTDRSHYEKAYEKLSKEKDPSFKVLLEAHATPDKIWGDPKVKGFVYYAYLFHSFTSFLFYALASHRSSKYRIPKHINIDVDYQSLPSVIAKMLKVGVPERSSYSLKEYHEIIQQVSKEARTDDFDFKSFGGGDLSVLIDYMNTVKADLWSQYKKFKGPKKRQIESKESKQGKLFT